MNNNGEEERHTGGEDIGRGPQLVLHAVDLVAAPDIRVAWQVMVVVDAV